MKALRVLGIVVAVVVVVLGAGLAWIATLDPEDYRDGLTTAASRLAGRPVHIDGAIDLGLLPTPRLRIERIRIANPEWASRPDLATVARAEAVVALEPLLSGSVDVRRLALDGVDVALETDAAGRGNWETGEAKAPAAPASASPGAVPLPGQVAITDAKVAWTGATGTHTVVVDELDATAAGGAIDLSARTRVDGHALAVRGTVALGSGGGDAGKVALDLTTEALGARASVKGSVSQPGPKAKLDLALKLDAADPAAALRELGADLPGLEPVAAALPAGALVASARLHGDRESFAADDISLTIGKSDVEGGAGQALAVRGTVGLGPGEGEMRKVALDLTTEALGARAAVKGSVSQPGPKAKLDLALKLDAADPAAVLHQLDAKLPGLESVATALPGGALAASAHLRGDQGAFAADDLSLTIGKSDLEGRVGLADGRVDAEIGSKRWELREPAGGGGGKPIMRLHDDGSWEFSADPLPIAIDPARAGSVKLSVADAVTPFGEIGDLHVDARLDDGVLAIKPLSFVVDGGHVKATVRIDGHGATPAIDAKIDARDIDLAATLARFGVTGTVTGRANVDVDLAGHGRSARALVAGLGGKVRVVSRHGRIDNETLDLFSSDVVDALNDRDDREIECAVADLPVAHGVASVRTLLVRTGGLTALGSGEVRLTNGTLALRVEPSARKTSLATAALAPVEVDGTVGKPAWEVDPAGVAGNVAAGAARTFGALATGGLSLLVEKIAKETVVKPNEVDYCAEALGGHPVSASKPPRGAAKN